MSSKKKINVPFKHCFGCMNSATKHFKNIPHAEYPHRFDYCTKHRKDICFVPTACDDWEERVECEVCRNAANTKLMLYYKERILCKLCYDYFVKVIESEKQE